MRIAVNTRFLIDNKLEGIGWFTHEVAQRLVQSRPDDDFLFLFDRRFNLSYIYSSQVKGQSVFPPARHPWLWWWWYEKSIPRVLKKWKADVFFSPDGYCSLTTHVPTVMVTHDLAHLHFPQYIPQRVRRYYDANVPKFMERAEKIVAVSEFTKMDVVKQYGVSPEKISVACNGCKEDFVPIAENQQSYIRKNYTNGQDFFVHVGAIHPRKNIVRLIKAYEIFKKKNTIKNGTPARWQNGMAVGCRL